MSLHFTNELNPIRFAADEMCQRCSNRQIGLRVTYRLALRVASVPHIKFSNNFLQYFKHAAALEYLKNHLTEGAYALDVGSGSGYLTVCMALMTGSSGKVVGIEHIPQLVELAKENTMKHHADLINSGRILFVEGDGRKGYPMEQKYDAIHVGAAAETIPQPLIDQLAEGGRMLIPVGKESGNQ
ncbi:putative protein-L-isoaspartate O-methyltransferase, partial [Ancylostoma duodenale]